MLRSNQLSYSAIMPLLYRVVRLKNTYSPKTIHTRFSRTVVLLFDSNSVYDYLSPGVPYGIRTHDPRIKSPMLSSLTEPAELREHEVQIELDYILSRKKGDLDNVGVSSFIPKLLEGLLRVTLYKSLLSILRR